MVGLQFPTILIELPEIPGATALEVPFDAPGRFEDSIEPPVLVMATLRALRAVRNDTPPPMWILEIESDWQAGRDLIDVANRVGIFELDGGWHERNSEEPAREPLRRIDQSAAMAKLWRVCRDAVQTALKARSETPTAALDRLTAQFAALNETVATERQRRAEIVDQDWLTRQTWPFYMALWWVAFRNVRRAIEGATSMEQYIPHDSWKLRVELECTASAAECVERAPYQRLLHECRRTAGLMMGVRIGGPGLEVIDTRLMEATSFALDPGGDIARGVGGMRWEGVCFDVKKLLESFPAVSDAATTKERASGVTSSKRRRGAPGRAQAAIREYVAAQIAEGRTLAEMTNEEIASNADVSEDSVTRFRAAAN